MNLMKVLSAFDKLTSHLMDSSSSLVLVTSECVSIITSRGKRSLLSSTKNLSLRRMAFMSTQKTSLGRVDPTPKKLYLPAM